jgi:hypothetical protein
MPAIVADIDQLLITKLREYYAGMPEADVRKDLTKKYESVWNDAELTEEFATVIFDGPLLQVIRKSDAVSGTVAYIDAPRLYFGFEPDILPA